MKKKFAVIGLLSILSLSAISLSFSRVNEAKAINDATTDMSDIALLLGESIDTSHIIYDDFSGSTLNDNWVISHRKWGGYGNNGVSADNVYLNTTNHKVIIKALGNQHIATSTVDGVGGPISGGALVLKESARPGRYETRFKPAYKVGVCNAFWTYTENNKGENHEIDIEFPFKDNQGNNCFNNVIFTNYIGETNFEQKHSVLDYYLNDGEYHTFAFDWYYSANHKVINYYIDAKLLGTNTLSNKLPFLPSRLWLGCWIPNNPNFVGLPDFDECFMEIDYFKYSPFLNQDSSTKGNAGGCGNTSTNYHIIDKAFDKYDWLSNGAFNNINKTDSLEDRGYQVSGTARLYSAFDHAGTSSSGGLKMSPLSTVSYKVDSTNQNFKYIFSSYYKGEGDIKISFYNKNNGLINTISIVLPSKDSWTLLSYPFVTPSNSFYTVIEFKANSSDLYLDDLSMVFGEDEPVTEVVLLDIVLTSPKKTTYKIGEQLDLTGLVVTGIYSDGSHRPIEEYTVNDVDLSTSGTKLVTITVNELTASFYITIDEEGYSSVTLTSISIEGDFKKVYYVNEPIDFTGLVVKASYSDGSQKVITNYQISQPSTSSVGIKRVTIIYIDKMVNFDIEVKEKEEEPSTGGCGGSVIASSSLLFISSLFGLIALGYKKKSGK